MKIFLVLSALLAVTVTADILHEWNRFKTTHSKEYGSPEEEKHRLEVFKENLRVIKEQNARYHAGEDTHILGVTQFSDLTDDEFVELTSGKVEVDTLSSYSSVPAYQASGMAVPDSYDWRNYTPRVVEPPRNQGTGCKSCWAFAAAEMVESFFSIKINHTYYPLSPQHLLNCVFFGCTGGLTVLGLNYARHHGVALESKCPYTAKTEECQEFPGYSVYISNFTILKTEDDMKEALVKNGPLGVSVDSKEWKQYVGGVYKAKQAFNGFTHDLVVDGYGTENGEDYWLLRNSWGTSWGEKGYIRIKRNTNEFGVGERILTINS